MKRFWCLLFLIQITALAGANVCDIDIVGNVAFNKDKKPYFILNDRSGSIFSIKSISVSNDCPLPTLNAAEIFPEKAIVKTKGHLTFDNYNLHTLHGTVSQQDGKFHILLLSAREVLIRAKAKMSDKATTVKLMMKSPMVHSGFSILRSDPCGYGTPPVTKFEGESNYIVHLSASVNGMSVLQMYTSPNISQNPILNFRFRNIEHADEIKIIAFNNKGVRQEATFPIRRAKETSNEFFKASYNEKSEKINTKAFSATSVADAIKAVYPHFKYPIEGKITIGLPEVSSNSGAIPVTITSDIDLESVAIFSDATPYPTVAIFANPLSGFIDYRFKIKIYDLTRGVYKITVVGKDRNGKFYKTVMQAKYALGDCCGCA